MVIAGKKAPKNSGKTVKSAGEMSADGLIGIPIVEAVAMACNRASGDAGGSPETRSPGPSF